MLEESLTIPSYILGEPEKAPEFMRNFAYQRAKRSIYPYALQDNITDKKENRDYIALYLENKYVKLCVLPEIGGRLFYAINKTNNYDIFYHQSVIKPANVGMLGAWISGGVEFNAFHHHRASSNLPVDYTLVDNNDGSKTIWVGETEPRQRMKWSIGITLYPDKSYIEISGRLINPTPNSNSILYWSNVATHVNENYQIIFPETTNFGVYHAKNSFCHWPVTHEVYVGKDHYKENLDASWWKNHPDPVSIFAYDLKEGFIAGYDHGKKAGTMLVGDPNVIKGGKLWQWGPGAYGAMWDTLVLTDSDGPYAELMIGAYSDNQPDYSWLKPYEVKTFKKYWYGISETGGAKAANRDACLNLDIRSENEVFLSANVTRVFEQAYVKLVSTTGKVLYQKQINIAPESPFHEIIALKEGIMQPVDISLVLSDKTGNEIISYKPRVKVNDPPLPETVKPPLKPEEIKSIEELYLTGLRNKQFHHAFTDPLEYFEEALKRDPDDTRCNTQLGIHYRETGEYDKAAAYLRRAIMRLTKDYTRPADCEALYNLGLILQTQGKFEAAIDTLYRASWDQNFMSPAYYRLAQISIKQNNYSKALEQLDLALSTNANNLNALNLKSTVLRMLSNNEQAISIVKKVISIDPLNSYAYNEMRNIGKEINDPSTNDQFTNFTFLMRDMPESYLELAVSYINNGFKSEALKILEQTIHSNNAKLSNYPTIYYYLGYLNHLGGNRQKGLEYFKKAASLPVDYCFPYRLETVKVYEIAIEYLPEQANTYYYMGNLLYDKQPGKAIKYWQKTVAVDPAFALAYRNLGWGFNYIEKHLEKAIDSYKKTINLDNTQAIYFRELDELLERNGTPVRERLEILAGNHNTVVKRNDSFIREIKMLIHAGEYDKAIGYLTSHFFSRQEGIDELHDIYVDACLLKGESLLREDDPATAFKFFKMADEYPENQFYPRVKNYNRNAQIFYMTGLSLEKSGRKKEAKTFYTKAANTITRGSFFSYYQVMAQQKIKTGNNVHLLDEMISTGKNEITENVENFFVSFGPGKPLAQVNSDAYYKMGLGYLGKGENNLAGECFEKAIKTKPDHLWAGYFLNNLKVEFTPKSKNF